MHRRLRTALLLLVAVLVVAAAGAGFWYVSSTREGADDTAAGTGSGASPTPHVVTEPAPGEPVGTDPPPVVDGSGVEVTITWSGFDEQADVLEVDGFVVGVVESGGTCRLTATRSGRSVSAEGPAEADASTTQCGALTIDADELAEGTWSAVLTYESATSTGSSTAVEVDVPGR